MDTIIPIDITNNSNMKKRKNDVDDNININIDCDDIYKSRKRKIEHINMYDGEKLKTVNTKYTYKKKFNHNGGIWIKKQITWHKVNETWQDYLKTLNKIDTENNWSGRGEKNYVWVYRIFKGEQELECIEYVNKKFLIISSEGKK